MCTHLAKRGSNYYYRRKTPKDLIETFGKEVMVSLKTKDRKEAEVLIRKMGAHYDDLFASAAAKHSGTLVNVSRIPTPKPEDLTRLKWDDGLEIDDEDVYAFMFLKRLKASREKAISDKQRWNNFNSGLDNLVADAQEFIKTGIHPFEDKPKPLWKFEAQIKAVEALRAMKDIPLVDTHFRSSIPKLNQLIRPQPTHTRHLLAELITKWAIERKPKDKTIAKIRRVVSRFTELTKVDDVTQVTKKHCVDFKDKLLEGGSSPANVNQYMNELGILLNYSVGQAITETNPASGIRVMVKRSVKDERKPYDLQSLNMIFSSPVYTENFRPVGGKGETAYWLPILALYTGARLGELCQLTTDDIFLDDYLDDDGSKVEVWTMMITNEGEDQGLKNEGSRRRIPVHADLIKLGFLEYVSTMKKGLVFPLLTKDGIYASLSTNWSKWYGRYLRNTVMIKDKRLVFHSFRHTFKDYARSASISEEIHNALTGHSSGTVAESYGSDIYPLKPLVEAMNKYKVSGIVLPAPAKRS